MTPREQLAETFAGHHHAGQRYGDGPYITHLQDVADLARPYGEDCVVVAWLHDVLEDTDADIHRVMYRFGWAVAKAVEMVTVPAGGTRAERAARKCRRLRYWRHRPYAPEALVAAAADRLANVRACIASGDKRLAMYRREHADLRVAAYRPGLCDELWIELDSLLEETP